MRSCRKLLSVNKSGNRLVLIQFERFINQRRHEVPEEMAWQWQVKKNSTLNDCNSASLTKFCPKKSFFPRFKTAYKAKQKFACSKVVKAASNNSWRDYFSFLWPESKSGNKPSLKTCRRLLALRQEICSQRDWTACDPCTQRAPMEWYGQGEVHAIISPPKMQSVNATVVKPCAPPQRMVPRCVQAVKGKACPTTKKLLCQAGNDAAYKVPYHDFKDFQQGKYLKQKQFVCRFKCLEHMPKTESKNLKLSCLSYMGDFQEKVECPKQMFTRYKDVMITDCGEIKPVAVSGDGPCNRVEVKKGAYGRTTLLRPSGVRNLSSTTDTHAASNCSGTKLNHELLNKPYSYLNSTVLFEARQATSSTFLLNLTVNNNNIRHYSTTSITLSKKKNQKENIKKKDKTICSGCPGVRAAESQSTQKFTKLYQRCKKRPGGKCPGPTRKRRADEPPTVSLYQKCKAQALSRCNQPRPIVHKEVRKSDLPCQPSTQKKKLHTWCTLTTL